MLPGCSCIHMWIVYIHMRECLHHCNDHIMDANRGEWDLVVALFSAYHTACVCVSPVSTGYYDRVYTVHSFTDAIHSYIRSHGCTLAHAREFSSQVVRTWTYYIYRAFAFHGETLDTLRTEDQWKKKKIEKKKIMQKCLLNFHSTGNDFERNAPDFFSVRRWPQRCVHSIHTYHTWRQQISSLFMLLLVINCAANAEQTKQHKAGKTKWERDRKWGGGERGEDERKRDRERASQSKRMCIFSILLWSR